MQGPATAQLEELLAIATSLAGTWGSAAAAMTTVGQERAILRLFGVNGVDHAGHPLAAEVVDRFLQPAPGRLAAGVALPFAIAMAEYDLQPQELALEVAAGNVDLGLEAELLEQPDRRAVAMEEATGLARAALERIDANRTARRELLALLGDPPRPWLGLGLREPAIVDALGEAGEAIAAGIELLWVEVPASRELATGLARDGSTAETWRPRPGARGGLEAFDPGGTPVPTGSQRALTVLRRYVDEVAAERRGYVRLATEAPALAAPDQAVVAAFERIDLIVADPLREIVTGRVDPDRTLADHVFAHRLLLRSAARMVVPAGPLVVVPDLVTGVPSDAATRSGRALALQLLAVALARRDGIPADSIVVGAFPGWLVEEADAPARAAAEVVLRNRLLPDHPIAFVEPPLAAAAALTWQAIVAALLPDAGVVDHIVWRAGTSVRSVAGRARAAAAVAAGLRSARRPPELEGIGADHAARAVAAAVELLGRLGDAGWRTIVDDPLGVRGTRLGGEAVAERTEAFDPLAMIAATSR